MLTFHIKIWVSTFSWKSKRCGDQTSAFPSGHTEVYLNGSCPLLKGHHGFSTTTALLPQQPDPSKYLSLGLIQM